MSTYPHTVRIYRQGPGSHGSDDVYTPGAEQEVYNDLADVQDAGEVLERAEDGTPALTSDARIFLKDETKLGIIQVEDLVTVTFEDASTRDARVLRIRQLDGSLHVSWL